jgi:hypothetical protein
VNKLAKDLGGKCYNVFLILSGINELGLILLKINITNMKYKILFSGILLSLFFSNLAISQNQNCPINAEKCDVSLKFYFQESVTPLSTLILDFGPNDFRNGLYEATGTGSNWSLFDVDSGSDNKLNVSMQISDGACVDVPISANCNEEDCFKCPSEVDNNEVGKLKLVFDEPPAFAIGEEGVRLSIDGGSLSDGVYAGFSVNPNLYEYAVPAALCCNPINGVIEIQERNCIINNNDLVTCVATPVAPVDDCECDDWLDKCSDGIVTYLQDYYENTIGCSQWLGSCGTNAEDFIYHPGLVAIGDIDRVKSGYRLAVNGGMIATQIKVHLCVNGWCDYVFENDYELKPLNQVEEFIKAKRHLPNFPSEKQIVDDGGLDVKDIKIKQQEKIEEAFLHLIELDEKIELLRVKLKKTKEENDNLRTLLTKK